VAYSGNCGPGENPGLQCFIFVFGAHLQAIMKVSLIVNKQGRNSWDAQAFVHIRALGLCKIC